MHQGTAFADACQPKPKDAFSPGSFYQLSGGENVTLVICSAPPELSVEKIEEYRDEISCDKADKTIDGKQVIKDASSSYAVVFIGSPISDISESFRSCIQRVDNAFGIQEEVVIYHLQNPIQHNNTIDIPKIPGVSRYVPSVRTRYFYDSPVPFAVINVYHDYVSADVIRTAIFGIRE